MIVWQLHDYTIVSIQEKCNFYFATSEQTALIERNILFSLSLACFRPTLCMKSCWQTQLLLLYGYSDQSPNYGLKCAMFWTSTLRLPVNTIKISNSPGLYCPKLRSYSTATHLHYQNTDNYLPQLNATHCNSLQRRCSGVWTKFHTVIWKDKIADLQVVMNEV